MNKPILNILDYYRNKAFAYLGLVQTDINPNTTDEEDLYINNIDDIVHNKIREYNIWYSGDSDKIMNFYTRNILYNYNTEPLYDRNKRSYFWSVSSTEEDIKRTHSGQPRNMVDTLVDIVNVPECTCSDEGDTAKLKKILSDNNFDELYLQEHLPYELIEGWGAWKIDWDKSLRNTPILIRYRAEEVDFIYKERQLIAIIYKNYYKSKDDKSYVLFEVRRQERVKGAVDGKWHSNLIIEKELYELGRDGALVKKELKDLDQLSDIEPKIVISDYEGFLGAPCIIYKGDDSTVYGRSIYTGKIDLFDDLDQCLSQAANTVRRSTTHVYINNNYLERDTKTGMPIMPSAYDCKYVMLTGALSADGSTGQTEPVTTVQPRIDFEQYSAQAINILVQIVSGVMSPATLGIDIAKKDNAEAQREKEKVTIFTRGVIIREETKSVSKICNELLCAQELMDSNKITKHGYDVSVVYDEFADNSFEAKAETLLMLYNGKVLPEEIFVKYLFKGMSERDRKKIVEYIKSQSMMQAGMMANQDMLGAMGAALGGMNGNAYDQQTQIPAAEDMPEETGTPEMVGTASNMRK